MTESRAWDWNTADRSQWITPAEDCVYLAEKWRREGAASVLDLGCGIGRHTLYFAEKGFQTAAVDLSEEAVRVTSALLRERGLAADCRQADMLCLPFPDASFDRVFSYRVISHQDTAGVRQVIGEIRRVLKPGGKAFVTLCSTAHKAFHDPRFPRVDEHTVLRTEGAEVNVPHFFADKALLRELFRDFVFCSVRQITECDMEKDGGEKSHFYIEAEVRPQS